MKWNVFSLEAVKEALKPKFVLEKVRYVTDDEEYGEGESTRLVFRNVEEMPEIDCIKRTISTFIRDTYVHFKDKNIKPMRLWQDTFWKQLALLLQHIERDDVPKVITKFLQGFI